LLLAAQYFNKAASPTGTFLLHRQLFKYVSPAHPTRATHKGRAIDLILPCQRGRFAFSIWKIEHFPFILCVLHESGEEKGSTGKVIDLFSGP
jgi:hypothetical protein